MATALGLEYKAACGLSLQLAEGADFVATERMRRRLAFLGATYVQRGIAAPFDLRPFEIADFDGAQPMPISSQHQRGIALAVATLRRASAMSFSTSAGVRYSRGLRSALVGRVGTVRFT